MKNVLSIGTIKILLTAVLLSICGTILNSQEPEAKAKKNKKRKEAPVYFVDTVTVSIAEHKADTLYLRQSLHMDQLDSLILKKQKK